MGESEGRPVHHVRPVQRLREQLQWFLQDMLLRRQHVSRSLQQHRLARRLFYHANKGQRHSRWHLGRGLGRRCHLLEQPVPKPVLARPIQAESERRAGADELRQSPDEEWRHLRRRADEQQVQWVRYSEEERRKHLPGSVQGRPLPRSWGEVSQA